MPNTLWKRTPQNTFPIYQTTSRLEKQAQDKMTATVYSLWYIFVMPRQCMTRRSLYTTDVLWIKDRKMFECGLCRSKLFKLAHICDRNMEKWFFCKSTERTLRSFWVRRCPTKSLMEVLRLYHGRLWMYFWDVSESVQVLVLEPRLRQSSHNLTSPTDGWYFVFSLRSVLPLFASLRVKEWLVLREAENELVSHGCWCCWRRTRDIFGANYFAQKFFIRCVKALMPMFI